MSHTPSPWEQGQGVHGIGNPALPGSNPTHQPWNLPENQEADSLPRHRQDKHNLKLPHHFHLLPQTRLGGGGGLGQEKVVGGGRISRKQTREGGWGIGDDVSLKISRRCTSQVDPVIFTFVAFNILPKPAIVMRRIVILHLYCIWRTQVNSSFRCICVVLLTLILSPFIHNLLTTPHVFAASPLAKWCRLLSPCSCCYCSRLLKTERILVLYTPCRRSGSLKCTEPICTELNQAHS